MAFSSLIIQTCQSTVFLPIFIFKTWADFFWIVKRIGIEREFYKAEYLKSL